MPDRTERKVDSALLLDIRAAGEFLGLTEWQVRGLIANSELPVVKVGKKFYLRRSMLIRWCEQHEDVTCGGR